VARQVITKIKLTEPITLEDLRWLVNECSGFDGSSVVSVTEHRGHNQMDWDPATITVDGTRTRDKNGPIV
jgi:hypothetical protein